MTIIWNPHAQVIFDRARNPYARTQGRLLRLDGVTGDMLSAILTHADGRRSEQSIVDAVEGDYPLDHVRRVICALTDANILIEAQPPDTAPNSLDPDTSSEKTRSADRILLIGNSHLASALKDALCKLGIGVETLLPFEFESCQTEEFLGFERQRTISAKNVANQSAETFGGVDTPVTTRHLCESLADVRLAICALENVPYRALFDVNAAAIGCGTPCVFVRSSATDARIGPTVVPGLTACFHCAALQEERLPVELSDILEHFRSPATHSPRDSILPSVLKYCIDEVTSILSQESPRLAATVIQLGEDIDCERRPLLPAGDCPSCLQDTRAESLDALAYAANLETASQIGRIWPNSPDAEIALEPDGYRHVGILGGGTAGYLTALALRAMRPELKVTLIESSRIPVIGVGEATTPELVRFLHHSRFLGLDIADFFERVRPSLKLGIRFQWGLPPPHEFTFPFQRGRLLESQLFQSTINDQSLGAMLMMHDRTPLFAGNAGTPYSLLHLVRFAYHLDNRCFVRYLREEAHKTGIGYIDTVIADAELSPDGENVTALIAEDGSRYSFDLYVDCSGFRSFLLEQKLGSPFVSYADSLFTDHAVVANVPHDGTVKPYTLAETMNNGWCWNIPFETDDHRGYVFSSAFTGVDEAIAEMQSKNPGMSEPAVIKFRSGRHEHLWKGNVVAMGNAYGFVEPLESTALHMLVLQLEMLTTHFPASRQDQAVKAMLNNKVAKRWDALRWFLGIHYKFNRRLNTPFWHAARNDLNISGAEERIALFRERAPLSYRTSAFYTVLPPEFFSDDHSFDTVLMGQQLSARWVRPVENRATWQRHRAVLHALAENALPQSETLRLLRKERYAMLREFATREDSWLHTWVPA